MVLPASRNRCCGPACNGTSSVQILTAFYSTLASGAPPRSKEFPYVDNVGRRSTPFCPSPKPDPGPGCGGAGFDGACSASGRLEQQTMRTIALPAFKPGD